MGDLVSKEHDNLDTIMTVSFSDPTYLSKVQQIEEFSNYLISPLRKNYKVFHLSLTIVFFAIDKFLTLKRAEGDVKKRKTIENLQKIRARITTPIGCEVFSPTINHILPERTEPTTATHPSIHDTAPLHTYKPHLPTDQNSHNIIQHHTMSYDVIQHYTTSYNILQCHTTSYNIIQTSMLKSPCTQDSKTSNSQQCFPLMSLVKSFLALC